MKKMKTFAFIGVMVLSLAGAVAIASPPSPGEGQPNFCRGFGPTTVERASLTDEQKEQITAWHKEMLEHRKQVLQKEVEWGWITQEQANERVDFMEKRHAEGRFGPGMGMGPGGRGHHGQGAGMNGCCRPDAPQQ